MSRAKVKAPSPWTRAMHLGLDGLELLLRALKLPVTFAERLLDHWLPAPPPKALPQREHPAAKTSRSIPKPQAPKPQPPDDLFVRALRGLDYSRADAARAHALILAEGDADLPLDQRVRRALALLSPQAAGGAR